MMNTVKMGFYFLAMMGSLLGCSKDTSLPHPQYPRYGPMLVKLNPDGLAYVRLPLQKTFVYRDSAYGILDTVWVSKSQTELKLHTGIMGSSDPSCCGSFTGGTSDYYYEFYTLELARRNGQLWFRGIAESGGTEYSLYVDSVIYRTDFSFKPYSGSLPLSCFWIPFQSSGQSMIYQTIPSMSVDGNTYTNVHRFTSTTGLNPSDPNFHAIDYWWVKDLGIIKKEIRQNTSVRTYFLHDFW